MVGSMKGTYPMYACTGNSRFGPPRCSRHIAAQRLEAFIQDKAVLILEEWEVPVRLDVPVAVSANPIGRSGPRATVARPNTDHHSIVVRPIDALDGVVTGPDARPAWDRLPAHRKAAVLRFLFASIRVGESSFPTAVFDYSRVDAVRNPLDNKGWRR